jgi:YidC/Oxa1 family membrane protein insertase
MELMSTFVMPLVALVDIPIWNQYVHLLVGVLDGLASVFHNAGLAIIGFTIIVKTLMLPLTVQSIRSSKAMQELQPRIKELQKKHGNDRQRLSQETMALYQQHRVNPMAGCLPMIIQIPIFLGLYNAITTLSNSGAGLWSQPFLWIPSLAHPDPIHLLPIVAGIFQFVQTQMMRPANQQKSTDPQQAMMNSVMNVMPLTVVFFGWSFAAGPVVYWATQSIYSVLQQWFITGWGSLGKWAPFLPELPEHRRLGYRPPRDLDEVVVVSGQGQPVYGPGPMGWLQRKFNEAQQQALAANGAQQAKDAGSNGKTDVTTDDKSPTARAAGNGSAKNRNRDGRRKKANGGRAAAPSTVGTQERENGSAVGSTSGAVIIPRKAKPTAGKESGA